MHPTKLLYLVRHAETAWNAACRLQGHADQPLSPLGERQIQRLAQRFAARHLQGIYTSHLTRSRQTASAIAQGNGHGVVPVVERALAEIHLGAWEGLTPEEIDAQFDGAYELWRTTPSRVTIPQAEPLQAFRRRVHDAFTRIVAGVAEGETVVVTHGGVIASVLADVLGADYDHLLRRLRLDNAGVTALDCAGRHPAILWINATDHLAASTPVPTVWF